MIDPIKVTVHRVEKISIEFIPSKFDGQWHMYIIDRSTSHDIVVPMNEFLKVCRAFAADAENYK